MIIINKIKTRKSFFLIIIASFQEVGKNSVDTNYITDEYMKSKKLTGFLC